MSDAMSFLTAEPADPAAAEPADSFAIDNYMADFLQSVLFDTPSATPQSCYQKEQEEQEEQVPDMAMNVDDDDECESVGAPEVDPYQPENFETCQDCASGYAIGCTGCGQKMCMSHAYDDGEGGKGTYESSPGGFICVNCMLYHYY